MYDPRAELTAGPGCIWMDLIDLVMRIEKETESCRVVASNEGLNPWVKTDESIMRLEGISRITPPWSSTVAATSIR